MYTGRKLKKNVKEKDKLKFSAPTVLLLKVLYGIQWSIKSTLSLSLSLTHKYFAFARKIVTRKTSLSLSNSFSPI
jgi:hypothetical protein